MTEGRAPTAEDLQRRGGDGKAWEERKDRKVMVGEEGMYPVWRNKPRSTKEEECSNEGNQAAGRSTSTIGLLCCSLKSGVLREEEGF